MSLSEALPPVSDAEGRILLALAREAMRAAAARAPLPVPPPVPERLLERQGAFVTLRQGRRLRGCIGVVAAVEPLVSNVVRSAAAAACEDPRFPPVTPVEVDGLEVEISVLDPPRPIRDPDEIVIGRHGLMVTQGSRRGLLLPQVATERGWDRETFLSETCRKADLNPDAWRHGARIDLFGAQILSERGAGG